MLTKTKLKDRRQNLFYNDLLHQLDAKDPLIQLSYVIDWKVFDTAFEHYYSKDKGRPAKPIRLMVGLLMLKQLEDLSDERIVLQFKRNPYYQYFCGYPKYESCCPCDASELVHFRNRIGKAGIELIFKETVRLHGKEAEEKEVIIDSTVQEKNISYPTDAKLAIKIIHNANKIAKAHNIQQRRTYGKEVKEARMSLRYFKNVSKRAKAKKATKHLRILGARQIRELERKLPKEQLARYEEQFRLYRRVLLQKKQDKDKIYSLHEPHIYCMSKGKEHKKYEYGTKASVVETKKSGIIVALVSHDKNIHDSKTLKEVLEVAGQNRKQPIKTAICDRGYRGKRQVGQTEILIPNRAKKQDSYYQKAKKRALYKRRAAIEPMIGHLKKNFRLCRNYLKGYLGDEINLLLAASAWNIRKWIIAYELLLLLKRRFFLSYIFRKSITF